MERGFFGKRGWPCGQLNLRGSGSGIVMAAFRDMEEVSQGLVSLLGANRAEAQQRRLLGRHEQIVERLLETQDGAEQQLREVLAAEEEVAQRLLDAKEQACLGGTELQQLEAQLQKAGEEDSRLKASLLYPLLRAARLGPPRPASACGQPSLHSKAP
ncbi:Kinetochore Protein Spc24 [Manis pentadactyla]|nr:Kinetochore Protein Spc24 [Manis pentadactyla]